MSFYKKRKVVKATEYPALQRETLNPSYRSGIILPLLEVITLNQQNYKNFTFKVLKEYLFSVQIVNYFPKNFYLVKSWNAKIGILKSAGLVDRWMEKYIDKSYIDIKPTVTKASKLNITHLFGGFQILFCGAVLAVITFTLELLSRSRNLNLLKRIFIQN